MRRDARSHGEKRPARWRAGPEAARVPALAQRAVDLARGLARGAVDIGPAVSKGRAGRGGGLVVTSPVQGALLSRMELVAVELHDQPVFGVATVGKAAGPVGFGEPSLQRGRREPVGALDGAVIAGIRAGTANRPPRVREPRRSRRASGVSCARRRPPENFNSFMTGWRTRSSPGQPRPAVATQWRQPGGCLARVTTMITPGPGQPRVPVICGMPAAGKSTLAAISAILGPPAVNSDLVRKELAGTGSASPAAPTDTRRRRSEGQSQSWHGEYAVKSPVPRQSASC